MKHEHGSKMNIMKVDIEAEDQKEIFDMTIIEIKSKNLETNYYMFYFNNFMNKRMYWYIYGFQLNNLKTVRYNGINFNKK